MAIYRDRDDGAGPGTATVNSNVEAARRVLRSTFDADNHDSLSREVTALMLILSRIPYHPDDVITIAKTAPGTGETRSGDRPDGAGQPLPAERVADGIDGERTTMAPGLFGRLKSLLM